MSTCDPKEAENTGTGTISQANLNDESSYLAASPEIDLIDLRQEGMSPHTSDKAHISSFSRAMSPNNRNADEAINDALLEKLRLLAPKPQDSIDTFRVIVAKIHSRITSSDRRTRERILEKLCRKNSGAMEAFVTALENCKDHVANCSISSILRECISCRMQKGKSRGSKNKNTNKSSTRIVVTQLINLGITQVLIKLLMNAIHVDSASSESLIEEILWILAQVIDRDQKFVPKMKSHDSIKMFHLLLKQRYNNGKSLLPLLVIMKSLAKNSFSLQVLAKDGIANTFEKTFVYIGYTPQAKLKTLLETLKYFTTSRLCCVKFVKVGLVHLLMRIFERWERFDGPIKLKICSNTLNTLQHICTIKAGRKIIKSNNGLQLLYRFCANCPEDKAYDCLLSRVCGIINQCLEKQELPVPEMSPARFTIPEANMRCNSAESGSDVDSQTNSASSLGKLYSDFDSADEEDNSDSRGLNGRVDEMDENKFFAGVFTSQRSERDLIGYNVFLEELGSLSAQLDLTRTTAEDSVASTDKGQETIETDPLTAKSKQATKNLDWNADEPGRSRITCSAMRLLEGMSSCPDESERHAYRIAASKTRSVIGFTKIAYPDAVGGDCQREPEPLNDKDRKVCRHKLLMCMERGLRATGNSMQRVAYDLDALIVARNLGAESQNARMSNGGLLSNNTDEKRVGKRDTGDPKQLRFESRFESGNLRKAIQIGLREYDLILSPDVNSGSRHQWFYFEVSYMESNVPYTFNIINCEKPNSQFNFGMKPILYSVAEAQLGRAGWVRTGVDICYYRNCYQRPTKGKHYLTTSFTVIFPHAHDVCYLAYHFPYTYSRLMVDIWKWSKKAALSNIYFQAKALCETLNDNQCPLLTVTSPDSKTNPIHLRKIIFLTSRVHPGESNASWIMHGTLEALLNDSTYAASLRDDYIFKIVPMLNIEGVVNGCNRYGLTNEDLNRRWSNPSRVLHPVIYHTKGLMEYCTRVLHRPPHVFVDYHGHSRRKNVFLFGCSRSGSWSTADRAKPDQPVQYLMLPYLMQKTSPAFALPLCSFKVERNKESTARVAIWRQLGVSRSYTMESSFCGCDQGALAGLHLDTKHLKAIGEDFCRALSMLKNAGNDLNIEKYTIPMGEGIPEESTCMDGEASSTCDTDESDSEMSAANFS